MSTNSKLKSWETVYLYLSPRSIVHKLKPLERQTAKEIVRQHPKPFSKKKSVISHIYITI